MARSVLKLHKKSLVLSLAAITTALIQNPSALAQDQPALEEITVTGSRIRQTDGMAAPTPVTVITPDELSSFEPGGTVAQQLDALPQFFSTRTVQDSGGGTLVGSAAGSFLNMRSLGENRTLVLLDGARMAPADKNGAVNVDTFPTGLVRTVDIVTGGASAAYGADALGGVTNFILDREFEGLKISTGTGILEYGDGVRYNASIAGGFQIGERLNIIGSLDARYIEQIERDPEDLDSDWYQRWGHVTNPDPNGPARITMPWIAPTDRHVYGMISGTGTVLDEMVFNREGTQVRPFINGTVTGNGRGTTNSTSGGPEAELAHKAYAGPGSGQEVISRSMFVAAQYQFTDTFSAYVQASVGRAESNRDDNRATTTGISLRSIWAPRIAVDNAYVPDYVRDTLVAAGRTEFVMSRDGAFLNQADIGIDGRDHAVGQTETYTVGFEAVLPWDWDLSGSYSAGESKRKPDSINHFRVDRVFLAMDAVRDPVTGAIVCRVNLPQYQPTVAQLNAAGLASGKVNSREEQLANPSPLASPVGLDDTISGCVPFNVMGFGNISQEAIDYVGTLKKGDGVVEQDFAEIITTGELYEGWGYGPVSGAFGLTWRESSFSDQALPESVDALGPPLNAPDLGIRGIPPGYTGGSPNLHQFSTIPSISGGFNVWEWFGEVQAPIWESASGAQSLGGSAAFRRSDYNLSGSSDSWKIGLELQLMEGLRFRTTKSRDVREATFSERFDAQGGGSNIRDPRFNDASFGISTVRSGNPDLAPEVADTLVAGFVYQPTWLDGFSISSDWYEVDIADSIEQIGTQDIVDRCEAGDPRMCANIVRDGATGEVVRIFQRYFNLAQDKVEGVDLEVTYRFEPNFFNNQFETFSVRALAGWLLAREDISANGTFTDRLGVYTLPDVTANVTANYGIGPVNFMLQGRYIDGGELVRTWVEGVDVDDNMVASSTTWNSSVRYSSELNSGATWNVALSVQNLFDKHPPITPGGTAGAQGVAGQYDAFGRRYQLALNLNF